MAKQFLDATGLLHLWNKISSKFLPKEGDITAPENNSDIRLIPSSGNLNYNIIFRDLNNNVDLLSIGTNGHTGQDNSIGQIILSDRQNNKALQITPGGLVSVYNSSSTKVFATNGNIVDMPSALTENEINDILV